MEPPVVRLGRKRITRSFGMPFVPWRVNNERRPPAPFAPNGLILTDLPHFFVLSGENREEP